jgi:tRNA(Leu) C34 or U34 (ribose-2'-O)-methylase TrmL
MSRGFAAIGLFNPKTGANIGGAMRACGCYGVSLIVVSGERYKRIPTDTIAAYRTIPLVHADVLRDVLPLDCVPVAVEILPNARSLITYTHPERAFYIFGPEDGTLGKEITSWCRDIVYIPTNNCMNLAATVNVVLYDRMAKR